MSVEVIFTKQNELCHFGVKGQKWGVRRYQNKDGSLKPRAKKRIEKAEKYLGRKLQVSDGFSKDGSDITRKGLKNVKQWDEQEKRYKEVKKKGDPVYGYLRGLNLTYGTALSVKDIDRIIKKMKKNQSLDVMKEQEKMHRIKAGKKVVGNILVNCGTMTIATAATMYIANRR